MTDDEEPPDVEFPFQDHSHTSRESARLVGKERRRTQEAWVYEYLRKGPKTDAELWNAVQIEQPRLFFSETGPRRARVQLVWVNRKTGATQWHPVEYSGIDIVNPESNHKNEVWHFKERFKDMPYNQWVAYYSHLARPHIARRKKGKVESEPEHYPLFDEDGFR